MATATDRATRMYGWACSLDLTSATIRPDSGLASLVTIWWSNVDCIAIKPAPICLLELLSFLGRDTSRQRESSSAAVSTPRIGSVISLIPHTAATSCTQIFSRQETL